MFQRLQRSAILLLVGFAAASPVLALGFGRIPESIPFGQPLELSVPLRLEGGAAPPGCLQAQVRVGDRRLPPSSVQVQLEGRDEMRLRLRSAVAVQEPTVTVQLTMGCDHPVSRQFVVFADPALAAAAEVRPAAPLAVSAAMRPPPPRPDRQPQRAVRPAPRELDESTVRMPEPAALDRAVSPSLPAASAAQEAASDAEQRLLLASAELERLRGEVATQHALLTQMRARLDQADAPSRAQAAWVAFPVSLGLVALWLGWRARGLRRGRAMASGQVGPEVVAADTTVFGPAEAPAALPLGRGSELPSSWVPDARSTPARGVDELIDLEQEVEFFVLLGDEHAAIDLLEAHLGGSGGGSPLSYLQLLQMHRGQQDRAAYAQVAKRFGQRFGVEAPGWDADGQGRELHDCPVALTELQARWASPAQAVAWLEQQLFTGPGSEMPGLPAYRDLLTLYAIARELQGHAREADTEVDVLLPLDGSAAPRRSIFDTLDPAPKATVDLDLSEAGARPH